MTRRVKRLVGGTLLVLLGAAAIFLVPTVWFKPWVVDHYYARVFLEYAFRHPMTLTGMGLLEGTPISYYEDDLDDLSVKAMVKEAHFLDRQIEILHGYDRKRMHGQAALSYDVLDWFLTNQQQGNQFLYHNYPVNQMAGMQSELPDFLLSTQSLKSAQDAVNFVKRTEKLGVALDQVVEQIQVRADKGILPPRFVLTKCLTEMRGFAAHPPTENPLYTHFATRTDSIPKLTPSRRTELLARLKRAIEQVVVPGYGRLIAAVAEQESLATTDDGVWKLPDGDAYYDWALRNHTTTTLPADTVHALGVSEVERIQKQMRDILRREGYRADDLAAVMKGIREEPRFRYPVSDSGRTMIIADFQSIIDDSDRRSEALFDLRPKKGVEVQRVPVFREKTAPGAYYQGPTVSGSRPGIFFINLRDPAEIDRPGMRTLAYHEAIPGHHFQGSIALELTGVPFFRKVIPFTAFSEGWALYAERLALEHGYHPTPFDSLGAYQAELFRAVRLVVDTGIHRKHWTREQAIDYMMKNTGMPEGEVVAEIERYIVNPGQACAYKVGQLKLLELRQRAQDRLGERFDLKRFHNAVLTNGDLPLTLLERVVEDWIASELAGAHSQRAG